MIKSITITKRDKNFTNKLYRYKNGKVIFNFTDGVNIITGRNASGKSVLLKEIKGSCGIWERGNSYPQMVGPMEMTNFFGSDGEGEKWKTMPEYINSKFKNSGYPQATVDWDGNMVHYLTPEHFSGHNMWDRVMNGHPSLPTKELFDGVEVIQKFMSSNSAGESTIQILNKMYNLHTEYEEQLTNVNDMWKTASKIFQDWIHSFPTEKGKPTLLIDELDSHLDLDNQKLYWDYIGNLTKRWQVIVVSHSIFAFRQKNANHIKLNPEYFKKVIEL